MPGRGDVKMESALAEKAARSDAPVASSLPPLASKIETCEV